MSEQEMVQFYLMGKPHQVPKGLTIQKAMEYAGFPLLRGCGCRGGFCGACGTVYRTAGDYRLKVGLACQTVVEDQMFLALIPFYPAVKATYTVEDLPPTSDTMISLYPEILRCVGCNSCRKVCPQEIEVMRYIAAAQRGDVAKTANLSFDCLMCGLCASRCPAEIVQYNVAILARRLYARHVAKPAAHLAARVAEIGQGACEADLDRMVAASEMELKGLYAAREIEPETL
ncbi:MAG TPA: 4Fe-4S dicluster domain-containing protein [Candidatus Sulfotelmatobacter sp.]|nr:4Fe-4S dicluster domain-containing protein [Candidatus Sulfotelmatobacter sp.]